MDWDTKMRLVRSKVQVCAQQDLLPLLTELHTLRLRMSD